MTVFSIHNLVSPHFWAGHKSPPSFASDFSQLFHVEQRWSLPRTFRVTTQLRSATLTQLCIAMAKSLEVSPMKSLAEELEFVRKSFRESIEVYSTRVETQLTQIRENVLEKTKKQNLPAAQIRDLRDMITLCRTLDLKPEKGRRKDLKKIDTLLEELGLMIQNW
jgi:hypothetical protein